MELLVTLVNNVQPLSVATDNTILDIMGSPRPTSGSNIKTIIIPFYLFILEKGIPIALWSNKRCSKIGEDLCLPVETAVQFYERHSSNARLNRPEAYGVIPYTEVNSCKKDEMLIFFITFQALGRYSNLLCQVMTVCFEMECFAIYFYLKY